MVDQECQDGRGNSEELHSECVMVPIISGFELAVNHPDCGCGEGTGKVDHRHARAVQWDVVGEEVRVPGSEHHSKQDPALA